MLGYFIELVCENGHLITGRGSLEKLDDNKYCRECGARVIAKCLECDTPIRGAIDSRDSWLADFAKYDYIPSHCHECGKPYPWTQSAIEAATMLIEEDDTVDSDLKEKAIESLKDAVADTPKTVVAASRFRKVLSVAGKYTADALRQILVDVASEAFLKASGLKP